LGSPRSISYSGEERFVGSVCRGLSNDVAALQWVNKSAAVVGMGAFAIETMRTGLENGAGHIFLICRRRGSVCPMIIDWMNFVRPLQENMTRHPAGDASMLQLWQRTYELCGATRPECWAAGSLKPDGHTVSVSDMFFVASYFKLVNTYVARMASLTEHHVHMRDGSAIAAEILIKCVGFVEMNGNEHLLGRCRMRACGAIDHSLWLVVEGHLDSKFFNNPFGSSYVNAVGFLSIVLARCWRSAHGNADLEGVPWFRVNRFDASTHFNSPQFLSHTDMGIPVSMREHVEAVRSRFHGTLTPEAYCGRNRKSWDALHYFLGGRSAVRTHLTYFFDQILDLIGTEAPSLLRSDIAEPSRDSSPCTPCLNVEHVAEEVLSLAKSAVGDVEMDQCLLDAGLDSLAMVELTSSLEVRFATTIQAQLISELRTSRALADHIASPCLTTIKGDAPLKAPQSRSEHRVVHRTEPVDTKCLFLRRFVKNFQTGHIIVIMPSTWGTVDHYSNLASRLPNETWGFEHESLHSTAIREFSRSATLEEYSFKLASVLAGCSSVSELQGCHFLGGSFGALLAQKVAVESNAIGAIQPLHVVMIDPPPAGPCLEMSANLSHRALAQQMFRLALQVAGRDELAATTAFQDVADDEIAMASAANEALAKLGQSDNSAESLYRAVLRMRVFCWHMLLWHQQERVPRPYVSSGKCATSNSILLQLSSGRRAFFSEVNGVGFDDNLSFYGPSTLLGVIEGEHTAVIQRVCTGREDGFIQAILPYL